MKNVTFNSNRTIATITNVKIETSAIISDNDLIFFESSDWVVSLQMNSDGFFFTADDGNRKLYTETYDYSDMKDSVYFFRSHHSEITIIIHEAIENWLTS